MNQKKVHLRSINVWHLTAFALIFILIGPAFGGDLPEIKQKGILRHLGVPYSKFVTGSGDGLDTELVKLFADYLGVKYAYVKTTWEDVIGDLTGKKVRPKGDHIEILGDVPVKGNVIACGLTILAWRQKILSYSIPVFPTGIWLVARADLQLSPIKPSGDIQADIAAVKLRLTGHSVLGVPDTCLDPALYGLKESGAKVIPFLLNLNKLVPAILNHDADTTIMDAPDALIALQKWPGKIKVIGPVSAPQKMAYGFAQSAPQLRGAFNSFFKQCQGDGTYLRLIKKYYPAILKYYPEFFEAQ
jgi:ABC-type amino acid transport substrate-binding protein